MAAQRIARVRDAADSAIVAQRGEKSADAGWLLPEVRARYSRALDESSRQDTCENRRSRSKTRRLEILRLESLKQDCVLERFAGVGAEILRAS